MFRQNFTPGQQSIGILVTLQTQNLYLEKKVQRENKTKGGHSHT